MMRSVVTALALSFSMVPALVHADSFMTSVSAGSKTAAKIGPAPYTGGANAPGTGMHTVRAALKLMKSTQSAAIRMDAVRVVDGVAMSDANAGEQFARGLSRLAQSGKPGDKFIRSYNKLMRSTSPTALAAVERAANALPNDAAIQLGAFQAAANVGYFGNKSASTARFEQAAQFYKRAETLAASSKSPLVKADLASSKAYMSYYPELQTLTK